MSKKIKVTIELTETEVESLKQMGGLDYLIEDAVLKHLRSIGDKKKWCDYYDQVNDTKNKRNCYGEYITGLIVGG